MKRISVFPLDFDQQGNPKDRFLFDAAQKFSEKEFGKPVQQGGMVKTWCAVEYSDSGEGYRVVGMTTIAFALDCQMFHVEAGDDSVESRDAARAVRDALMARASSFIQDQSGVGTEIMVFVSPKQERFWKGYLRLIGATPANRHIVKV